MKSDVTGSAEFNVVLTSLYEYVGNTSTNNTSNYSVPEAQSVTIITPAIELSSVSLTGSVTTPVKNATDESNVNGENVDVTVDWSPELMGGKFAANTEYTATITVTPKSGYVFAEVATVSFDGFTFVKNEAGNFVASKTFDKTSEKSLSSIAVTTAPTKISGYIHGDSLDTTGMVVTATYDDGTSEVVSGYNVAVLKKGDTKATVTYGGKTAEVNIDAVGAKELEVTGLTATDREYNKTTDVTLTGGTLVGVVGEEDVSVVMPTSGKAENANAGNRKVTVETPALSGADAGNYTLKSISGVTVNITPKNIASTDISVSVDFEETTYTGLEQTNGITLSYKDSNLTQGTDYTVSGNTGTDADDYTVIVKGTGNYSGERQISWKINPKALNMTAAVDSKQYDGKTSATVKPGSLNGVIGSDDVKVAQTEISGTFESPYVGSNITVTASSDFTLTGAKKDNYSLIQPSGLKGNISTAPQTITISAGEHNIAKNTSFDLKAWASSNAGAAANLVFSADSLPYGVTLSGSSLEVASSVAAGTEITIKVNSAAVDVNSDGANEYGAASEQAITVKVVNKKDAGVEITDTPAEGKKTFGDENFTMTGKQTSSETDGKWIWTSSNPEVISIVSGENTATPTFKINKVGTATISVTYESNGYFGSKSFDITIGPKTIANNSVSEISGTFVYSGAAHTPKPSVSTLTENVDYTLSYENNINAGTASVTVTGIGNYKGTITRTFEIQKKNISDCTISGVPTEAQEYTGSEIKPAITVKNGEFALGIDDYSVSYSENINVGKASITIEGIGTNYTGEVTKYFDIKAKTVVPSVEVTGSYSYIGTNVIPNVVVKIDGNTLANDEYSLSCQNNINAGTATVTVSPVAGKNYTWEAIGKDFTIGKADYTVSVTEAQNVKVGSGLAAIKVPSSISGVNGETVSGEFKFYSDAARTTLAVDSDISAKSVGDSVTLYWSFSQTNVNYIESKTGTVTVTIVAKDTQTIVAPDSIALTYGDPNGKISASLEAGNGTISYEVTAGTDVISVDSEGNITVLKAGTAEITVIAAESDEYAEATKTVPVTVSKKVINKPSASSEKFVYNGKEQTYNVAANSAYDVDNNKRTNAGTQTVTVALKDTNNYIWNDNTSEDITFEFIIEKATVTITAKNIVAYIGEAKHVLSDADYIVTGLASGEEFAVLPELKYVPEPDMSKANTVVIEVSGAEVPNTDNYNTEIVYVNGSYSVREIIHVSDPIIIGIGNGSHVEIEENPNTGAAAPSMGMISLLAVCGAAIVLSKKNK